MVESGGDRHDREIYSYGLISNRVTSLQATPRAVTQVHRDYVRDEKLASILLDPTSTAKSSLRRQIGAK